LTGEEPSAAPSMPRGIARTAAALPAIVLFVAIPTWVHATHAAEFELQPGALSLPMGIGLLTALPLAMLAGGSRGSAILSAIGLVFLTAALLPGSDWMPFDSDTTVRTSLVMAALQLVIVMAVIVAVRRHARPLILAGALTSVALLAGSAALLLLNPAHAVPPGQRSKPAVDKPNIYHFIFDGFSSRVLTGERLRAAKPMLAGFTFFPDNRANYFATDASLPSMFTSSFFQGGAFRDFQARAREGGFRKALQDAGYSVTTYTPDRNRFWWYAHSDAAVTAQDLGRARHDGDGSRLLLQASLVRASPIGTRQAVLWFTRKAMPWTAYNRYKQDAAMLDRFLEDEAERPARGQYVYFHIMVPHPPYLRDGRCQKVGKGRASYTSQADCALTMMRRVVDRLRALGKFDGAMIIFQGDHGFHSDESNLPPEHVPLPETVRQKLDAMQDSFGADALMERSQTLLVVKRPNAALGPLRISPARTQLIDIGPTIAGAADVRSSGLGLSVFSPEASRARDWHFFAGITRKHGLFRKRMGRDTEDGHIAHISLDGSGRWHIHPDIVAGEPSDRPAL